MTDGDGILFYPPERSAVVPCPECGGTGERPEKPPAGSRWAEPKCRSCHGTGQRERKHYAYCKRAACVGCLPTIAELEQMPWLDVAAEMLARCIPQSPDTKTHEGAVEAVRKCDGWYGTAAYFARRYNLLAQALEARHGLIADDLLASLAVGPEPKDD